MNGLRHQSQITIEIILNKTFLRREEDTWFFVRSRIGRKQPERRKSNLHQSQRTTNPTGSIHRSD